METLTKRLLFWFFTVIGFAVITLILIWIFKPTPPHQIDLQDYQDSVKLATYQTKIDVLSDANAILSNSITLLFDSIQRNETTHRKQLTQIKKLTTEQLRQERAKYIISGTDSSELVQEVGYYKELDHCIEQGRVKDEIITTQSIKIDNLECIIDQHEQTEQIYLSMIDRRDATIEDIQKRHKKELRRVKWAAGGVVVFVFGLGFIAL